MSESDRVQERADLANLDKRHNFIKNPRFQPPHIQRGGKSLIVPPRKVERMVAGRRVVVEERDPYEPIPVFLANPPVVFFTNYRVGQIYETSVELRNLTSSSRPLRVIPPSTPHFAIGLGEFITPPLHTLLLVLVDNITAATVTDRQCESCRLESAITVDKNISGKFPGEGGLVAPGMSCLYTIRFAPDSQADYEDFILVETQTPYPLLVPIEARCPPPILTLPSVLDCGYCLVSGVKVVEFLCRNEGLSAGRFCIMPKSVWPATNFRVLFLPSSSDVFKQTFTIVCDNCQVKDIAVTGTGQLIALQLMSVTGGEDTPIPGELTDLTAEHFIRFGALNPHSGEQKKVVIRNATHLELPFHWQMMKPNLKPLMPGEAIEPDGIEYNLATDKAFDMSPGQGILAPHHDHDFILSYCPHEMWNNSIAHITFDWERISDCHILEVEPLTGVIGNPSVQNNITHLAVQADIQKPRVCLQTCELVFQEIYLGVPVWGTVNLLNQTMLPAKYSWGELIGKQASQCSATVFPSSGIVGPKETEQMSVEFTAHTEVSVQHPILYMTCDHSMLTTLTPVLYMTCDHSMLTTLTPVLYMTCDHSMLTTLTPVLYMTCDHSMLTTLTPVLYMTCDHSMLTTLTPVLYMTCDHSMLTTLTPVLYMTCDHSMLTTLTPVLYMTCDHSMLTTLTPVLYMTCDHSMLTTLTPVLYMTCDHSMLTTLTPVLYMTCDHSMLTTLTPVLYMTCDHSMLTTLTPVLYMTCDHSMLTTLIPVLYMTCDHSMLTTLIPVLYMTCDHSMLTTLTPVLYMTCDHSMLTTLTPVLYMTCDHSMLTTLTPVLYMTCDHSMLTTLTPVLYMTCDHSMLTTLTPVLYMTCDHSMLTTLTPSELTDTALLCSVTSMEEPLVLEIFGKASGLHVTFSVPSDSPEQEWQDPSKLLLDFGAQLLNSKVKQQLIITNHTAIPAPFSVEAEYFCGHLPSPPADSARSSRAALSGVIIIFHCALTELEAALLSHGKGAVFFIEPSTGTLGPFQKQTIEITAFANMWGEYWDNLICRAGELDPVTIPMQISVKGCPLYFQMTGPQRDSQTHGPIVRFGTHISGGDTVSRSLRINNPSPYTIRMDWETLNQEKGDLKLVDLLVSYGDAFPLKEADGNEVIGGRVGSCESRKQKWDWDTLPSTAGTSSSMRTDHEEEEEEEEGEEGEQGELEEVNKAQLKKIISVNLQAHEGTISDYPYCITPRQILVPAGGSATLHVSFTPLTLSEIVSETECAGFALGFLSLDSKVAGCIPGKVERAQGYELEPLRLDLHAFVKPALLTLELEDEEEEEEGVVFYASASDLVPRDPHTKILLESVTTRRLRLLNRTETPLYFRLLAPEPFSVLHVEPWASMETSHSDREEEGGLVLHPQHNMQVTVAFRNSLTLLTYQNQPENQLPRGAELIQSETGERKLRFSQQLVVEYSNKSAQCDGDGVGWPDSHDIGGHPHHSAGSQHPQHRQTQLLSRRAPGHQHSRRTVAHLAGITWRQRHNTIWTGACPRCIHVPAV
ncbi:UNVERIFIED_CONTAM: hypothetical protein FKN15_042979 [Acipenser sinensis]